ncbi:hypothetical protein MMC12_007028 [Toensbergia leucococca]|nr:hypothetical protein [Toensbergia leucococca]
MRFSTSLLLALPAVATAQFQIPLVENLQPLFDKAKSFIPPSLLSPVAQPSNKIAAKNVTPLTRDNWQSVLSPSTSAQSQGPENWMVFVSGGNKTCYGRCDGVEQAWNESAALFAATPTAPHLGYINCDTNAILCSTWAAGPPAIWYIELPIVHADQSAPATTIHIVTLNTTTATTQEIFQIHTKKTYEEVPVYEGAMHPFDGWFAKAGLNVPLGYVLFGFSIIPSWAFMIIISMFSRTIMSRRVGNPNVQAAASTQQGRPLGGAPAANQ